MADFTKAVDGWRVVPDPLGKFIDIFGDIGMPIATITIHGMNPHTDKANAHLIAHSPRMYQVLEALLLSPSYEKIDPPIAREIRDILIDLGSS